MLHCQEQVLMSLKQYNELTLDWDNVDIIVPMDNPTHQVTLTRADAMKWCPPLIFLHPTLLPEPSDTRTPKVRHTPTSSPPCHTDLH